MDIQYTIDNVKMLLMIKYTKDMKFILKKIVYSH